MAKVQMQAEMANRLSALALLVQMEGAYIAIGPVQVRVLPSKQFEIRHGEAVEAMDAEAAMSRVRELVEAK